MSKGLLTNEEINALVAKAAILTSTGGQLSAQQASDFVNLMTDQTPVLQEMQVISDIETSYTVDGLEFGSPVIRKPAETTTSDGGDPRDPDMPRLTLQPVKFQADVDISYDFIRKNVSRENAEEEINAAIAKRIGMDVVNLVFNGDTTLADDTAQNKALRIIDGFIKQVKADADVNDFVVAASPTYVGAGSEFGKALAAIPKEYRDNRMALRHFASIDTLDAYEDEIADRPTGAADAVLFGSDAVQQHKRVKIVTPFGFPNNTHLSTVGSNLVVGFGRNMKMYRQEQHRKQKIELTIVGDIDCGFVIDKAIAFGEQA